MNWDSIPTEQVAEGIQRQMVVGDKLMICRLKIQPRVVTAVHTHEHEQMTLVERGRVLYIVDGVERVCSAGDVLHFPPYLPHGATMLDEEVVLVDVFTPRREDFLTRPRPERGAEPPSDSEPGWGAASTEKR